MKPQPETYPVVGKPWNIRAVNTGEKRPPKEGEYCLSGAIVEAWVALADLRTAYYIARLVEVEQIPAIFKIKKYL